MMEIVNNSSIPPISSLPQWPRFGIVERTVAPNKPRETKELKEIVQLHNQCEQCGGPIGPDGLVSASSNFSGIDVQELAKHLDKSIQFLKVQQHELLSGLHEEVDKLKKENRDLQYKLMVAEQKETAEIKTRVELPQKKSIAQAPITEQQDQTVMRLRKEIDELKVALEEAKQKNGLLEKIMDQQSSVNGASMEDLGDDPHQQQQLSMHTRALEHCDRIIKHLQLVNEQQSLEVTRLKAELKDLLATYRPAPDVGLLSSRNKMMADAVRLPKLASESHAYRALSPEPVPTSLAISTTSNQPLSNQSTGQPMMVTNSLVPRPPSQPPPYAQQLDVIPASSNGVMSLPSIELSRATIHLPPLKQVVPTRIAERKKQIEVLHKARLKQISNNNSSANGNNK